MSPTVKHGDSCPQVSVAKILTGYSGSEEDFDAYFVSYISAWQRERGLNPDAVIGEDTWRKIAAEAPTVSTSKLRKGRYAQAVQLLVNVDPDGIFGERTKAAVAAFQSAAGLTADGIVGPKTWAALLLGERAQPDAGGGKRLNDCAFYLQGDKRWKSVMYSNHGDRGQTIGNSGCGPTSMAMILATWTDAGITPVEMCELAQSNGYRTYSSGTSWGFYAFVFKKYAGFGKYIKTGSFETLIAALREGALAVCSMNSGDNNFWTKGGHYIVARGVSDDYIYANDPAKSSHPRKQACDKFRKCLKQAFIFYRAAGSDRKEDGR